MDPLPLMKTRQEAIFCLFIFDDLPSDHLIPRYVMCFSCLYLLVNLLLPYPHILTTIEMPRKLSKRSPSPSPSLSKKRIVHFLSADSDSDYSDSDFTQPRTTYLTAWPISARKSKSSHSPSTSTSTSSSNREQEDEMEELDQDPFAAPNQRISFYRPRNLSQTSNYEIEPSVAPLRLSPTKSKPKEEGRWKHVQLEEGWQAVGAGLKAITRDGGMVSSFSCLSSMTADRK